MDSDGEEKFHFYSLKGRFQSKSGLRVRFSSIRKCKKTTKNTGLRTPSLGEAEGNEKKKFLINLLKQEVRMCFIKREGGRPAAGLGV